MKIYTCTPKAFFSEGLPVWWVFTRDLFLQSLAFRELGHESMVVLLDGPKAQKHPDIMRATMEQMTSADWWRELDLDIVVLGAWAMPEYTPIAKAIKDAGVQLIVRCDSNGKYTQLGHAFGEVVRENYWSLEGRFSQPLLRSFATVLKTLQGYSPWSRERGVIEHLSYADLICIESPVARDFVIDMLKRRKLGEVASKVKYIAHPVKLPDVDVSNVRRKKIICVGRWNAYQKNTPLLARTLNSLLIRNVDYEVDVVGGGEEFVHFELDGLKCAPSVRERIHVLGIIPNQDIAELYNQSQINFISSRWESFNIAAAEALCMGCSVVGPIHIPSIRNFTSKESGTYSVAYTEQALLDALQSETEKWTQGRRDPIAISTSWREELSAKSIGEKMLSLVLN